jgi:hypothetical protein
MAPKTPVTFCHVVSVTLTVTGRLTLAVIGRSVLASSGVSAKVMLNAPACVGLTIHSHFATSVRVITG